MSPRKKRRHLYSDDDIDKDIRKRVLALYANFDRCFNWAVDDCLCGLPGHLEVVPCQQSYLQNPDAAVYVHTVPPTKVRQDHS